MSALALVWTNTQQWCVKKLQLKLHLLSAKTGKASSSDGKRSNLLHGREAPAYAYGLVTCEVRVCWSKDSGCQRDTAKPCLAFRLLPCYSSTWQSMVLPRRPWRISSVIRELWEQGWRVQAISLLLWTKQKCLNTNILIKWVCNWLHSWFCSQDFGIKWLQEPLWGLRAPNQGWEKSADAGLELGMFLQTRLQN